MALQRCAQVSCIGRLPTTRTFSFLAMEMFNIWIADVQWSDTVCATERGKAGNAEDSDVVCENILPNFRLLERKIEPATVL